jgi:hypothetical protein
MAPAPASSNVTDSTVHSTLAAVGTLPTSGSCGQLFVYEKRSPGRSVTQAQAVHEKNSLKRARRTGSVIASSCSA